MSAGGGECVKVVVRCRPMNSKEKALHCAKIVSIEPSVLSVGVTKPRVLGSELAQGKTVSDKAYSDSTDFEPKRFTFDGVYDDDSTQQQVYDDTAYPLLQSVFEGYNGTIFAYGQTGCGKTFTMEGVRSVAELRGIIPTAFAQVFALIGSGGGGGRQFLVRASYIEIYNEEVRDLTSDNPKGRCEVKEDKDKGVYIKGLNNQEVHSEAELEAVMTRGNQSRTVGATLMNADSSRSHSIFCITVEMSEPDTAKGGDELRIKQGKLNLVDLAGSERQAKTMAEGVRLKEATKINLSLSALGNVIEALVANAGGKQRHIPYRDSKLTRLLSDSLGGNTKTIMIAAISPADYNFDETLSTLRYANRAKNIKNKPVINEDPKDALLREYQDEIKQLKLILQEQGLGDLLASLKLSAASPAAGSGKAATKALPAGAGGKGEVSVAAVAAALSGPGADGEDRARELEEELERLSDEKAQHERMRAVIDAELTAAQDDDLSRAHERQQLELRIQQEQAASADPDAQSDVVDLLKAERARLDAEQTVTAQQHADSISRMQAERQQHEASIADLEAAMQSALQVEQQRRQELEDKLAYVTQHSTKQKETLLHKLQLLQQKLLVGNNKLRTERETAQRTVKEQELAMKRKHAETAERQRQLDEQKLFMEEKYNNMTDECTDLRRKLRRIAIKYHDLERENSTLEETLEDDRAGHVREIREREKASKLYQQICAVILTGVDLEKIVVSSVWQDGRDEWQLPIIDLPAVFPIIHSRDEAVQLKKSTDGFLWGMPSWRQRVSQQEHQSNTTNQGQSAAVTSSWRDRLTQSSSTVDSKQPGDSKYFRGSFGGSAGWRRGVLSELSREELQAMARERVQAQAHSSPEQVLQRSRQMSEQIDTITSTLKRRETFQPIKTKQSNDEKEVEPPSPAAIVDAAGSAVKKRPAFQPAKIITTRTGTADSGNSGGSSGVLPDSAYSVPVRPVFSPKQPASAMSPATPLSPQSAGGLDLNNLPRGRPAFTPGKK